MIQDVRLFDPELVDANRGDGLRYGEPLSEFLAKSNRNVERHVRCLLEDWFRHYPEKNKNKLKNDFASKENCNAAAFELTVHASLRRSAENVVVEPPIDKKRPDFGVHLQNGDLCLVECACVFTGNNAEKSQRQSVEKLIGYVNATFIESRYMWSLTVGLAANASPVATVVVQQMRDYESQLMPSVEKVALGEDLEVHSNGWILRLRPFRLKPGNPKFVGTVIPPSASGYAHSPEELHKKINTKVRKYRDYPMVLALNVVYFADGHLSTQDSLMGSLREKHFLLPDGKIVSGFGTQTEGILTGDWGRRHPNLVAVVCFFDVDPWKIGHARPVVYRNPFANRQILDRWLLKFAQASGQGAAAGGMTLGELFDLPSDWPSLP